MRFILIICLMFLTGVCYSAPSTSISTPNNFTPNTTILSSQVNDNFNEVSSKYNSHSHTDITQVGTITSGVWNGTPPTSVGTVTTGVWEGTPVATTYGGTGQDFSAVASNSIIYFNPAGTMTTLPPGASGSVLVIDSVTLLPKWVSPVGYKSVLMSNGVALTPSFNASNFFGVWATGYLNNTNYLAATDGFVTATSTDAAANSIDGYTNTGTPAVTSRAHSAWNLGGGSEHLGVTFPVKKGDYWRVDVADPATIMWLSTGS